MKNPFLPFHKIKNHRELLFWFLFHLGIPALLGLSLFFAPPLRINTLLLDMLPKPGGSAGIAAADKILSSRSGRETVILAAAPDFETAKNGAAMLYNQFKNSAGIENLTLYFDSSVIAEFADYLFKYRFMIAGKDTLELLETGRTEEIAYDALASAYGAFTFLPLDNLDKDPFLLAERRMGELLTSSILGSASLSVKDDVLAVNKDGTWYVLLRMTLSDEGVSLNKDRNAVVGIYRAAASAREELSGLEFYFSGMPFHSYESSSGAQKEISVISSVSILAILLLFIFIFRTPLPVILAVFEAFISLGLAASAALLVFREIHILTFVFGTTLIGTCVDYSIHFFIQWKGNPELKSGYEIRSYLRKSLAMCFISTEICFLSFLFAPFPILKQFAVFSMTGLASSFLTAYIIFPLLKKPEKSGHINSKLRTKTPFFPSCIAASVKVFFKKPFYNNFLTLRFRGTVLLILAAACAVVLAASPYGMKLGNDIRSLYTMSGSLLESEIRTAQVLDFGSQAWYFIVSGGSPEEVLENEEKLAMRLDEEVMKGNLGSYLGTHVFVPSKKTQKKTYEAMKAMLPLAGFQFEALGFPPEYENAFYEEFTAGEIYCLPEDAPGQAGISGFWIGETGGRYYSSLLLFHTDDEALYRSIAGEFEFTHFISKANDIGRDLDTLTRTIILAFLAAYLVVSVIAFIVYPWRDSIKICAVPFFLIISALALLALNGIPLSFFSIAALVLVLGLGLDYIFYMISGGNTGGKNLTPLAVLLSFLTTILSFGALALSSFVPVHIFGLTVTGGLTAAFISAMLLTVRKD